MKPDTSHTTLEGFWLPKGIREKLLTSETEFVSCSFAKGRPCEPEAEGAVTARWPRLEEGQWKTLLAALEDNRKQTPSGKEFWDRYQAALKEVGRRFANVSDPLRTTALGALPGYTGYSEPMIELTIGALDMFSLSQFPAAFSITPTKRVARDWLPMPGLNGRLRFYPSRRNRSGILRRVPGISKASSSSRRPFFGRIFFPEVVLGYGAGNIPGAALLIAFLAQSVTLAGGRVPSVITKNSRSEPIFSPLVFRALEEADPDLVSTVAIMVWDYEDATVQDLLTNHADLIVAAASDETIAQIQAQITRSKKEQVRVSSLPIRFHSHGHKVSFSAIGKEMLLESESSQFDVVTLLAALDSVFWDQHGCLSSRVHFLEVGGSGYRTPMEYATKLQEKLRLLANFLPRGAWPLQQLHDRFDRYKNLEMTGSIQVVSQYNDEWLVVLDQRRLGYSAFRSLVNDCQGRIIVVKPVSDLMEIPDRYLRMLPAENLQSLSVAVGRAGEGLTEHFLSFAEACGDCGVTAIRTVGRGAFPQLAYSWDGYLPMDLARERPAGRFTTIEFDSPFEEIQDTYRLLQSRS